MHCELVNEHIRHKYENQFYAHFANHASQLIYRHIYTQNRVRTKDLFCYISDQQYMSSYVPTFQEGYKEIIARGAEYFQSPTRITTEMPLMILTNTKDILLRRKKKLKKVLLVNCEASSRDSSYSSNINPQSSSSIFLNDISKISFTYPQSSQLSSQSTCSVANIYEMPAHINEVKEIEYNFTNLQRQHINLRLQVQMAVKHLIIEFKPCESSIHLRSKRNYYQMETDSTKTKEPEQDRPQISNEIKSVVKAQLQRYNIHQIRDRNSSTSSSQFKVRDKAARLLQNLQMDI